MLPLYICQSCLSRRLSRWTSQWLLDEGRRIQGACQAERPRRIALHASIREGPNGPGNHSQKPRRRSGSQQRVRGVSTSVGTVPGNLDFTKHRNDPYSRQERDIQQNLRNQHNRFVSSESRGRRPLRPCSRQAITGHWVSLSRAPTTAPRRRLEADGGQPSDDPQSWNLIETSAEALDGVSNPEPANASPPGSLARLTTLRAVIAEAMADRFEKGKPKSPSRSSPPRDPATSNLEPKSSLNRRSLRRKMSALYRKAAANLRARIKQTTVNGADNVQSTNSTDAAPSIRNNVLDWFTGEATLEEMQRIWKTMDFQEIRGSWRPLLRYTLQNFPDRLGLVFQVTATDPMPPGHPLARLLNQFIAAMDSFPEQEQRRRARVIGDVVCFILANSKPGQLYFAQHAIFRLLKSLEVERVEKLYNLLVEYKHFLYSNTLLQFASRFATESSYKRLALEIVVSAFGSDDRTVDINSPPWSSVCTSLLLIGEGKQDMLPSEVLGALLPYGFVPNVFHYTAMIRSLCKAGELQAIDQVLDNMEQQGIKPNLVLCTTLLQGARRAGNMEVWQRAIEMASGLDEMDAVFWNDAIYAIYSFADDRQTWPPRRQRITYAFAHMARFYARLFDIEPLQRLLPVDLTQLVGDVQSAADKLYLGDSLVDGVIVALDRLWARHQERFATKPYVLCSMLRAYVDSVSEPYDLIALYAHFDKLLRSGDPIARSLVTWPGRQTQVHDIIIRAMCWAKWPWLLRSALDIASDMLKGIIEGTEGGSAAHPAPSVHTFSILIYGFMRVGKRSMAERVLETMREIGVEPSLTTWNSILSGYAWAQDVEGTVKALQKLDAAGFTADQYTHKAFGYLEDTDTALSVMQELIDKQRQRIAQTEEAREGESPEDEDRMEQPFGHIEGEDSSGESPPLTSGMVK